MKRIIIATDGSAVTGQRSAFDSASSYIILKDGEKIKHETTVLRDHTNNYAEMHAIYKGTKYCLEHILNLNEYEEILIITDSQLCQKSLTMWMSGWLKKAQNELLVNSTGEAVKNQELIKSTYINILSLMLQIDVHVCHINSHEPKSKVPQMYEKASKLIKELSYEEFVLMYEANNACDVAARDALK